MPLPSSHYLHFARSLALTSTLVLTACIASPETGEPNDEASPPPATPAPSAAMPVAAVVEPHRVTPTHAPQAAPQPQSETGTPDAGPSPGHVSGPLPPPELPSSFA